VPYPVGLSATAAFYETILRAGHVDASEPIESHREELRPHVESFRADFAGARIAYAIRMKNVYSVASIAYDGLGFVAGLQELGLDVELLIQGAPDPEARASYQETLLERGYRLPFHVFASPEEILDILQSGSYQGTYLPDSSWSEARRARVPIIGKDVFQLFFSGVPKTIALLRQALETKY